MPFDAILGALPPLLFRAAIVALGTRTNDGQIVEAVTIPWLEIVQQLVRDPDFLAQAPWRKVEEMIAGAYVRAGWTNVILTPHSGDRGRDIIAEKSGECAIRVLDQVKAFRPGRRVSANDVRAMLHSLTNDRNVSKAYVTTTADFAPGIDSDPTIAPYVPYRLELRDGAMLRAWLLRLRDERGSGV